MKKFLSVLFLQGIVSRLGRSYKVIPCTKRGVFESTLPTLADAPIIVTSVLSNFICDAGLTSPDRLLDAANAELHDHVQALHKHSQAHPHVKIVVVPPLARTNPDWFNPYLACLTANLYGEISKIGNRKIRYLSPFISPPHYFEADGIHLNHDSGSLFIQFV